MKQAMGGGGAEATGHMFVILSPLWMIAEPLAPRCTGLEYDGCTSLYIRERVTSGCVI